MLNFILGYSLGMIATIICIYFGYSLALAREDEDNV